MNKYTIPKLLTEYAADFQLNIGGSNGLDKYFEVITKEDVVKAYFTDSRYILITNKPAFISCVDRGVGISGFIENMLGASEDNYRVMKHIPLVKELSELLMVYYPDWMPDGMPFESVCGEMARVIAPTRIVLVQLNANEAMGIVSLQFAGFFEILPPDAVEIPISDVPKFFAFDVSFDADAVAQALPV